MTRTHARTRTRIEVIGKGGLPAPMPHMKVLGIDPGLSGAFILTDGEGLLEHAPMPVSVNGKEKRITFENVFDTIEGFRWCGRIEHVFVERAVSFGMGTKAAFNYGRGFEALMIAIERHRLPHTLVEPAKWTKVMHAGVACDLKPKARSLVALGRLYPQMVGRMPAKAKGGLLDGPVDALLIAGYGLRILGHPAK